MSRLSWQFKCSSARTNQSCRLARTKTSAVVIIIFLPIANTQLRPLALLLSIAIARSYQKRNKSDKISRPVGSQLASRWSVQLKWLIRQDRAVDEWSSVNQ